jgi:beta-glucosidase
MSSQSKGIIYEGGGSAAVNTDWNEVVSLVDGLTNGGFTVIQKDATGAYLVEGLTANSATYAAANSDVGIVAIGKPGQEGSDNTSMSLSSIEISLIQDLYVAFHAKGRKLIVLLNVAGPVEIANWEQYADAILYVGLPGTYGANAISDILKGTVNPSGKLVDTWPKTYANSPTYGSMPTTTQTEMIYSEKLNIGYRYYDEHPDNVMYPFGYGLSYTTFGYSNLQLNQTVFDLGDSNESITVSVEVTNTGRMAGKEVAELYITEENPVVYRPVKELKAFSKTAVLQPGGKQTMIFTIQKRDLSYYDITSHSWIVNPGRFKLFIGGTSDGNVLKTNGVSATFKVEK